MSRNKHVFTCPDVLYMRSKAKRNNRIVIGATVALATFSFLYATYLERKENNDNVVDLKAVQND
jgi:hypothetical protein